MAKMYRSSIGLAIAQRLGQEGAHVVISSRRQQNIDAALKSLASDKIRADGIPCNVSSDSQRRALVSYVMDRHKRIDVFIHVAGTNPGSPGDMADVQQSVYDKFIPLTYVRKMVIYNQSQISSSLTRKSGLHSQEPEATFFISDFLSRHIMDVNVKSAVMMSQLVTPCVKITRGNILFVSSVAAYSHLPYQGTYSMSKTNLLSLTKILASELGPAGVRVNCIAPGIIKTKFSEMIWANDDVLDHIKTIVPLRRIGLAEDCAGAVAFLCSEDAAYITGEVIGINGGMQARL